MGSAQGQQTQRTSSNKLNPEKQLPRALRCDGNCRHHREVALRSPRNAWSWRNTMRPSAISSDPGAAMGDEPVYMLAPARRNSGSGHPEETIATLEALRERGRTTSQARHLLYAGRWRPSAGWQGALAEYHALSAYYVGRGAVRYGVLLARMGGTPSRRPG